MLRTGDILSNPPDPCDSVSHARSGVAFKSTVFTGESAREAVGDPIAP
jgi:hypothetical protein